MAHVSGMGSRLEFSDLQRFEESVKPWFRRALKAGRVDLLPPMTGDPESSDPLARASANGRAVYDEKNHRLVVPLWEDGRPLALLVVWGVEAGQLVPVVSSFLSALTESAVEIVRQRKAAETEPVTGLANERALDSDLTNALSRLTPAKTRDRPAMDGESQAAGLALLALEPEGMGPIRERFGRRFGDQVLATAARSIRDSAPEALCVGRGERAFFVLGQGGGNWAREAGRRLKRAVESISLKTPQGENLRLSLRLGAAIAEARVWEKNGMAAEAAAVIRARADRTLSRALRLGLGDVLFFGEIVERGGRIKEMLPLDRVLIDLGWVHGLVEGERFLVAPAQAASGQKSNTAKAQITVLSVGEVESVAQVTALLDPTWSMRAGDVLRRLGQKGAPGAQEPPERVVKLGDKEVRLLLDEVTGLPSHRSLVALFSGLCEQEGSFTAALMRVEGLEQVREMFGSTGSDALLKRLVEAAQTALPKEALLGRYAPDTLGALLPGMAPDQARELVASALAKAGQESERPLRAGLAGHPTEGFTAAEVMDNAAKALVHAGFLDPGAAVIFDAVSLNVSGDALFAQGRISEAVVEYEKALILEPAEPNVLNSLGVCYGHLGQGDKALDFFTRAMEAAPGDFMAYYNLGYAHMAQGRMAEARAHLEKSLELKPDHADTLFQLGRLAQSEGRLAQALEHFSAAAGQKRHPRAVHRHLGEALAGAGRYAEAEEAFKEAVKKSPNDSAALSGLAGMYLDRGANLDIALSLARRARELEPGAARHLRSYARALSALGRGQEAAQALKMGAGEFPDDPYLAVQRAQVEAGLGNLAAAQDEYTRALSLEPNLDSARQGLAELKDMAGGPEGTGEGK